MNLIERFQAYADDFELTFVDDDWTRFERYFTEGAVYLTQGPHGARAEGRHALLEALRRAVLNFDRRCDSRTLETTRGPEQIANQVHREWAYTFTRAAAPDLRISGSERALYEGDRICLLEERLTDESNLLFAQWLREHAVKLIPITASAARRQGVGRPRI